MSDSAARVTAARRAKERGSDLYKSGKWRDAADAFGEAIKIAPRDDEDVAVYHSNRAAALLQLGDAKAARSDAEKCVRLRPHWARGWSRVAAACEMLQDDAGAERALEKLISLDADNADARRNLNAVRARMRERGGASRGWRMPSMPSMPDVSATAAAGAAFCRMRYARATPNEQLAVKCALGVLAYFVFKRVASVFGFGGYGYGSYGGGYDPYDGGGFSLYTLLGVVALYYAHKSGASWWNLLSIANMFGLTGGGRRRGYGGYGGYGRPGFGGPGMFFR